MTIKKLTFCILCFVNAANLATDEDFNNENSSNSGVEENILINKNNWNTRKWGDIYFLFPHLSFLNIIYKGPGNSFSCMGVPKTNCGKIFNFIASGVVEYKYMFHKYYGINIRINLNNFEIFNEKSSFISFETSLEWIWKRKGKKIFSGSFSPWGFAIVQKEDGNLVDDFCKKCWTFGFMLLKYEYDRRFYLNFGKVKTMWYGLKDIRSDKFLISIVLTLVSIEFGLNIIGVNDWRKKRKENLV